MHCLLSGNTGRYFHRGHEGWEERGEQGEELITSERGKLIGYAKPFGIQPSWDQVHHSERGKFIGYAKPVGRCDFAAIVELPVRDNSCESNYRDWQDVGVDRNFKPCP